MNKIKRFLRETMSLFKTHFWSIIAVIGVTAVFVFAVTAPVAYCVGTNNVINSALPFDQPGEPETPKENLFADIKSWEDSAEQILSSCEVGYASVSPGVSGSSLSVFVTEVEDIDLFMLSASIYPSLIASPPSSLDRLNSVIIYFEDSSIFITLDESFSVPLARSSLLVDESSDSYQEIKTAYDTYFSPYKID